MKYILLVIMIFSILHIIRDLIQIKTGYKKYWIARFLHFWDAPQYEVHGIIVFATLAIICLYFFIKN